jgi:hypothetical protein
MSELEEFLKELVFLLWCLYVTVMSIYGAFQAEELIDVLAAFFVWGFVIAISAGIKGT